MGILYKTVAERHKKRQVALQDLKNLNIRTSQTGKLIEDLDYDELMYEWRLAAFKAIDIENSENGWY